MKVAWGQKGGDLTDKQIARVSGDGGGMGEDRATRYRTVPWRTAPSKGQAQGTVHSTIHTRAGLDRSDKWVR